jgi:hypothetical protein
MVMQTFLGVVSIQVLLLFGYLLCMRYPKISQVILIALVVRVVLSIINIYVIELPDSQFDAMHFEKYAAISAQGGFDSILNLSYAPGSDFYQNLIALVYFLLGRSHLLIQSINIGVSLFVIVNTWLLYQEVWGRECSNKIFYLMAIFPTLSLYSVITLREIYIAFFLSIVLLNIVKWYKYRNYNYYYIALFSSLLGMFFHGALGIYILLLLALIFKDFFTKKRSFLLLSIFTVLILLYFDILKGVVIPKIGTIGELFNLPYIIIDSMREKVIGGGAYPIWIIPENPIDLLWSMPIYILYFVFSPFAWDVSSYSQLFGMFDSTLYLFLFFLIWKKRSEIKSNRFAKIVFAFLLFTLVIFSVGTGNSGTAVRHRIDLLPMMFALIPFFKIRLSNTYKKLHLKV